MLNERSSGSHLSRTELAKDHYRIDAGEETAGLELSVLNPKPGIFVRSVKMSSEFWVLQTIL